MFAYITKDTSVIHHDSHIILHFCIDDIHYCVTENLVSLPHVRRIPIYLVEKKMNHSKAQWFYPDSATQAQHVLKDKKQEYMNYLMCSRHDDDSVPTMSEIMSQESHPDKTLLDVAQQRKWRESRKRW